MSKKILILTAYPLNNRTAGQNYTSHLVNDLASQQHQVDIIYWLYSGHENIMPLLDNVHFLTYYSPNARYKTIWWSITLFLFPLFTVRFNWKALRYVRSIAHQYDIIYFDFSQTFVYSLFISHPYKVLMCHDVIIQKYSRNKCFYFLKAFIRHSECKLLNTGKRVLCFSEKDKGWLSKLCQGRKEIEVVPFYIDEKVRKVTLQSVRLDTYYCFYAAWNRPENVEGLLWFIKQVLPFCPNVSFKIIGGGMPASVQQLLSKYVAVECLGFVDNPYPIIASSSALIAPLFSGAGVKVKVIESLALGTPVIGTEVAFEGINNVSYNKDKQSLLLAVTAQEMVEYIKNFTITVEEKVEIQKAFFLKYSKHRFSDTIS